MIPFTAAVLAAVLAFAPSANAQICSAGREYILIAYGTAIILIIEQCSAYANKKEFYEIFEALRKLKARFNARLLFW